MACGVPSKGRALLMVAPNTAVKKHREDGLSETVRGFNEQLHIGQLQAAQNA